VLLHTVVGIILHCTVYGADTGERLGEICTGLHPHCTETLKQLKLSHLQFTLTTGMHAANFCYSMETSFSCSWAKL